MDSAIQHFMLNIFALIAKTVWLKLF